MLAVVLSLAITAAPDANQHALLKTFRDEFVAITPGEGRFPKTFTMGSVMGLKAEQPVHVVTIGASFAMAKFEVPQNLWEAVMGSNPSRWKGPRNSVEMLTLDEAISFCTKATNFMREAKLIDAHEVIRLPTEAEWEYATRAGTATVYSFGDDPKQLGKFAWSTENAAGNDPPVGAKQPNPWGLYDVHGYLWEWTLDGWHPDYTGAPTDGTAWPAAASEKRGVVRSGSWKDPAERLTSSFRQALPTDTRDDAVGLRCVLANTK